MNVGWSRVNVELGRWYAGLQLGRLVVSLWLDPRSWTWGYHGNHTCCRFCLYAGPIDIELAHEVPAVSR